ncbi:MAG: GIY-YIG nuclease family protein [Magnetococcales bacterium]|nr:GIY-YIG nuclease family protein [Magnetococcales bacterium]
MPNIVKIGKTTREPSDRAKELSSFTSTPVPFIVVYEQLFEDCDSAENYIHTKLEQNNQRVANNREFFNAPVNEIIRIIAETPGILIAQPKENKTTNDQKLDTKNDNNTPIPVEKKVSNEAGKICSICGNFFPHSEFNYGNKLKNSYCRQCCKEHSIAYSKGGSPATKSYREEKRSKWKDKA